MARSSYVYLVIADGKPLAGFTVKRELLSWLARHQPWAYSVWRVGDNNSAREPVELEEVSFA